MIKTLKNLVKGSLSSQTFKIRFGIAKGLKLQGFSSYALGLFFKKPLTLEERFIQSLDVKGKTVYDIGAYIGIFTMFFARAVGDRGRVIVYEPNPINFEHVKKNLRINNLDNVDLYPIALGSKKDTAKLAFRGTGTATGSIQENIKSNILDEENSTAIEVEIDTLDNQFTSLELAKPDIVKIDVEGLELDVLQGMQHIIREHAPDLYIEIHGSTQEEKEKNAAKVLSFLAENDYTVYHVESEQHIKPTDAALAKEGHLWCVKKEK